MGRHVPVYWPLINKGLKFLCVLVALLLAWPGGASGKSPPEYLNYDNPYILPVVAIPEGGGVEHFFGTWEALNRRRLAITGAMTIGPERIKYADFPRDYDKVYKVLRVTDEYAVLVVHYKNPVRVGLVTKFNLLTLRRDPKDGETLLFVGYRNDFRLNNDEPLTRPIDFYRRLLDNPDEDVLPPVSGPWGQWRFSAFEPYKN